MTKGKGRTVTSNLSEDTLSVEDEHASLEAHLGKSIKYKKGEMRKIMIANSSGPAGDRPVRVSVQTRSFTVPRGVMVEVPATVAEVLLNAEETLVEWDGDKGLIFKNALSYPISVAMH